MKKAILTTSILAMSLSGCTTLEKGWDSFKSGFASKSKIETPYSKKTENTSLDTPALELRGLQRAVPVTDEVPVRTASLGLGTPIPLARPEPLKPKPNGFVFPSKHLSPIQAISAANRASSIKPTDGNYINAIQIYPYTQGSLYQVYASPEQITDIALEPAEKLTSVSAGDTVRWIVGDTVSGSGANAQVHILVKPIKSGIATNLVITTNRRTYYLELRTHTSTYMTAVSWRYPRTDFINQLRGAYKPSTRKQSASSVTTSAENLNFAYKIKGDRTKWRPLRAYDDGRRVFIQFPDGFSKGEAPPLFIAGPKGTEVVNYRIKGNSYIVDKLFDVAELRLGGKKKKVVRIIRKNKS